MFYKFAPPPHVLLNLIIVFQPSNFLPLQAGSAKQCGGRPSRKVDVYSYGVVLWQLASKKEPYAGVDKVQITLSGARLPVCEGITPALAELVEACRARDPGQRPDMAVVMACLQHCQHIHASPELVMQLLQQDMASTSLTALQPTVCRPPHPPPKYSVTFPLPLCVISP